MQKTISNRIIRKLNPCYSPSQVVTDENEELPVVEWVEKYRNLVHSKEDIIWLLCNKIFMSDKDMRLFAVWCAREALKLVDNPDTISISACDVAERHANGEVTTEELFAAMDAVRASAMDAVMGKSMASAMDAVMDTAMNTARASAMDAARDSAWAVAWYSVSDAVMDAAWDAARDSEWDKQIDQLLTYFK